MFDKGVQFLSGESLKHKKKELKASRKRLQKPDGSFFYEKNINTIKIHPELIKQGSIRAISLYLFIKGTYKNSTVYKFSVNKVSKIAGISHASAKKLTSELVNSGLAVIHNGNFTCVAFDKSIELKERYAQGIQRVSFGGDFSIKNIKEILYLFSIKQENARQNYVIGLKDEIALLESDNCDFSAKKQLALNRKKEKYNGNSIFRDVVLTTRTLAKKWDCSISTVSRILNDLRNKGLIQTEELIHQVCKFNGTVPMNIHKGFNYVSNGYLYSHRGTAINITF